MKIRTTIPPVLLMSLGLSGCIFGGKKAAKITPPAPAPTAGTQAPATPPARPSLNPTGPQTVGTLTPPPAAPPQLDTPALKAPELPPTDKPAATPPRRSRPRPSTPQPSVPAATAEQQPAPMTVPQLGEILSDAQRRQVQTDMAEHLVRARDILTRAMRAGLNTAQVETRERVRIFIQQAEDARERDPKTALELARRADVLAQDLAPALR
jgi:hypothetical protein